MSTVTVTPTVDAVNEPPRVRLDVVDSGSPNLFATTVVRYDPDGRWRPVRTYDGGPLALAGAGATRTGLIFDYEAPIGSPVTYSTSESPTVLSAQVTVNVDQAWLIHPGIPELSCPIVVAGVSERTRRVQRGVFYPMGRRFPVVQTDGRRKAAEYTLKLYSGDDVARRQIEDLIEDAGVLLLNVPTSKSWGIGTEYIAAGDSTEERAVTFLGESTRFWGLSVAVVDRPAGGTQSERTYDDVNAAYATYDALDAAYSSYTALLAGP
jgi:hypothetical protein